MTCRGKRVRERAKEWKWERKQKKAAHGDCYANEVTFTTQELAVRLKFPDRGQR